MFIRWWIPFIIYFFNVLYSNGWQQIVHEEQVTIWLMFSNFFNYSIHLSIHYKLLTHHKYFYISLVGSRRSNTIKWHETPMTMSSPWLCYSKIHTSIFSQVQSLGRRSSSSSPIMVPPLFCWYYDSLNISQNQECKPPNHTCTCPPNP
jgi:hypothetical protein